MKQKFSRSGITEYGKQQLRLEKEAMENVVASILFDYVPEDKQQGVIDRINEETSEAIRKIKDAQK